MKESEHGIHPFVKVGSALGILALAASQAGSKASPTTPEATATGISSTLIVEPPQKFEPSIPTITATATLKPTITLSPTPRPTETATETATTDPFNAFVEQCKGSGVDVSCIYADGILALHLERGDGTHISSQKGTAQLWNEAWNEGQVIGILAHDGAEGQKFYKLFGKVIIDLIWTNGKVERYGIHEQSEWRNSGEWRLFSPWDGGPEVSDAYLVDHYYRGGNNFSKMVLQTCLGTDTGVLFVVAYRVK
jgi:hypothetical protein